VCPPGETCGISSDGSAQCVANWAPIDDPNYRPDGGTRDAGAMTQDARTGGGQFEEVPSDFGVDNGAASGDAGPEPPQAAEQVSGCACRTPGTGPAAAWPLLLLVVPALRRRRRGR
jgi:MYXO-CTERM domain-containing protein